MANSNFDTTTIKEKFLNILFEPEDGEEDEVKEPEIKVKPKQSHIKATDILYGKKDEHESPFIDINEITKEPPNLTINEEFVSSPNISPIFGNIDDAKKQKKSTASTTLNYASVDKPNSSVLGMVLSPVYGYDTRVEEEKPVNNRPVKDVDVTEELSDIFATEEYKLSLNDDDDEKDRSLRERYSSFYTKKED